MLKKIPLADLEPGMFITSFDLSWFEHPFISTRIGLVRDREIIEQLRRLGVKEVEVDTRKRVVLTPREAAVETSGESLDAAPPQPRILLPPCPHPEDGAKTARFAKKLFDQAISVTKDLFDGVSKGEPIQVEEISPIIRKLVESVNQNENVLNLILSLRTYDDYTYTHCLNLAALGVLLGKALDLGEEDLELLGMGGMLHDVGKCLIPKEIIAKPGPLNQAEFERVKSHPELGHAYLAQQGGVPDAVLRIVREHHERLDGAGYPHGLSGEAIHALSPIISLVDVYDALTSDRVYRGRISAHMALRTLFNMRNKAFPEEIVDNFIKRLGIYPAFSLVQLRNGLYGMVTRQTPGKPLFPEVLIFCDGEKRPVARRKLDTWRLCGELNRKEYEIERPVQAGEVPIPDMAEIA